MRVGSNVIACPVVNDDGTEDFIEIPIKVPTGSDKGATPYDGYSLQEDYQIKLKLKEETAQKQAKAKAEKILRDEKGAQSKSRNESEKRELNSLFFYLIQCIFIQWPGIRFARAPNATISHSIITHIVRQVKSFFKLFLRSNFDC